MDYPFEFVAAPDSPPPGTLEECFYLSVKCTFTVCLRGKPRLANASKSGMVSELSALSYSLLYIVLAE